MDGPGEQWCRLPFKMRSGACLVEMLSRGDMLGRLGLLAGSGAGSQANDAAGGCCGVSGSMSPRQMGQGGMAGGVVAPGCVQFRSVGGPSSMGPPSSSVRSTTGVGACVSTIRFAGNTGDSSELCENGGSMLNMHIVVLICRMVCRNSRI